MSESSTLEVARAVHVDWAVGWGGPTDLDRLTNDDLVLLSGARPPYDLWCDAPTFCPAEDG